MSTFLRLAVAALALTLVACGGGGGGSSAADLERRLLDPGPFENEDPVVKAECPDGLASDDDGEVVCSTTTRRGVVNRVTIRNREGGLQIDSEIAATPTPEPESVSDPAEKTALERDIAKFHDIEVANDERRTRTIVCPDDFVEEAGTTTRCTLTAVDGSQFSYVVRAEAKKTKWHPDPVPADFIADGIVAFWDSKKPRTKGEYAECPADVPARKGATATCTLTTADGATHEATITMKDDRANIRIDFSSPRAP